MKKKKLKQHIRQLESDIGQAKTNEEIWKDMVCRFIEELKGYGVKTEIIPAEQPVVEVSRTEDMTAKYIHGMTTEPPTLSFDFKEHDKKVIYDFKRKCREDNEPEEIKQCKEFLKRENKCFIYISNFFATPMSYDGLEFSCGYQEIPMVKIKYENGIENEVALTELMKYDTLEKCEKRCGELNEKMKEYRESLNKDYWRLKQLVRENKYD